MNVTARGVEKRELINALRLRATELGTLVFCEPSRGRNAETRREDDAMSERKIAEQLGLPTTVLKMGRAKWVLFATPRAHNALASALNRLPAKRFGHWTLEHDL